MMVLKRRAAAWLRSKSLLWPTSYDTPEFVVLPIDPWQKKYLDWLGSSLSNSMLPQGILPFRADSASALCRDTRFDGIPKKSNFETNPKGIVTSPGLLERAYPG